MVFTRRGDDQKFFVFGFRDRRPAVKNVLLCGNLTVRNDLEPGRGFGRGRRFALSENEGTQPRR